VRRLSGRGTTQQSSGRPAKCIGADFGGEEAALTGDAAGLALLDATSEDRSAPLEF
jgi:hypothetical protein